MGTVLTFSSLSYDVRTPYSGCGGFLCRVRVLNEPLVLQTRVVREVVKRVDNVSDDPIGSRAEIRDLIKPVTPLRGGSTKEGF